jgi:signal transduction histidine kinase
VMVRFLAATAGTVVIALAVFVVLMRPSGHDLALMTVLLSTSALLSILIGYAVYRLEWTRRSPRMAWTLLGGYTLVGLLTFFNVWLTARMMFLSAHDLVLAGVLLLFGAGIAVSVGYLLSSSLSDEAGRLALAAQQVALGRLDVRLEPVGRDEMADIGVAFNDMAQALARAAEQQRVDDELRRDLIAWVGHDLHTPLTSVRVIIEALADGVVEDPDTVQRYLRTARKDIGVLSLLIDDLAVLAQIDAGGLPLDRQPNSLGDLVSDTLESFSLRAERQDVRLRGEIVGALVEISFDARHIGRVLANLIDNALRHTPSGGEICVTVRSSERGASVEVRDDGPGIDPADLPHVFDRFYRGEKSRSRATGGAGLGLAIAHGIVESHGGTITVDSTVGTGTSFTFVLPAS